jgi:hypothetical protein
LLNLIDPPIYERTGILKISLRAAGGLETLYEIYAPGEEFTALVSKLRPTDVPIRTGALRKAI